MLFPFRRHQVEELQKQIAALRGSLDEAVGALADEKQVQGTLQDLSYVNNVIWDFYRPQGKVMFSQVFAC